MIPMGIARNTRNTKGFCKVVRNENITFLPSQPENPLIYIKEYEEIALILSAVMISSICKFFSFPDFHVSQYMFESNDSLPRIILC